MKKLALFVLALAFFGAKAQGTVTFSQEEIDNILFNKIWCITSMDHDRFHPDGKWFLFSDCSFIGGEDENIHRTGSVLNKTYINNGIGLNILTTTGSVTEDFTIEIEILPEFRHPETNQNIDQGWGIDNGFSFVKCRFVYYEEDKQFTGILQSTNSLSCMTCVFKFPPNNWNGSLTEE